MLLQRREARYAGDACADTPLGGAFVIGGAALYRYVLARGHGDGWTLDGLLVTRIINPDVECDVFLDEFRTPAQVAWETAFARRSIDALPEGPSMCPLDVDPAAPWHAVSPDAHRAYVGQVAQAECAGHVIQDREHACQFQLWRRSGVA